MFHVPGFIDGPATIPVHVGNRVTKRKNISRFSSIDRFFIPMESDSSVLFVKFGGFFYPLVPFFLLNLVFFFYPRHSPAPATFTRTCTRDLYPRHLDILRRKSVANTDFSLKVQDAIISDFIIYTLFTGLQGTPSYKFGSVRSSTQYP